MKLQAPIDSQIRQQVERSEAAVRASLVGSQRKLHGFVLGRLHGNRSATEDVLQEFALRALLKAENLRDIEKVGGWLSAVLRSVLGDHWRHKARRREDFMDPQALAEFPAAPDPGPVLHAGVDLAGLIRGLRADQADLLQRIELDGETREHAAMRLGILPNALHVRLHRARRALKVAGQSSYADVSEAEASVLGWQHLLGKPSCRLPAS